MNEQEFILSNADKDKIVYEIEKFERLRNYFKGVLFVGNMFSMTAEDLSNIKNKLSCDHLDKLSTHQKEIAIDILNKKYKPVRRTIVLFTFAIIWIITIMIYFIQYI